MTTDIPAGYKLTEVGVIPGDWHCRPLNELTNPLRPIGYGIVQTGKSVRNGVKCVRVVDMIAGHIDPDLLITTSDEISTAYKRTLLCKDDVVIALRGKIGAVVVIQPALEGSNLTRGVALLSNSASFDSSYLSQYLSSSTGKNVIERNLNGSALQEIPIAALRKLPAVVPPLPEQRAIATALSDVDALLAKLDALIAKKRDLKQATMQQLLTGQTRLPGFRGEWEFKRMKSLGNTYGGLTGKTKIDFGHGLARYIPFMNVMTSTVIDAEWLEAVDIPSNEAQNLTQKGDLFFNGSSETPGEVGFCSVLLQEIPNLYLNSFCFGFRFNADAKVNGLFFAYWFRSDKGRETMAVLAQGATRYNIAKSAFLRLELPQPTQAEQTAIATVLSDMDTELAALQTRRDKTHALKQGMMQALLTGRIRLV